MIENFSIVCIPNVLEEKNYNVSTGRRLASPGRERSPRAGANQVCSSCDQKASKLIVRVGMQPKYVCQFQGFGGSHDRISPEDGFVGDRALPWC